MVTLRQINTSRLHPDGKQTNTANHGKVVILGQVDESNPSGKYCKFLVEDSAGKQKVLTLTELQKDLQLLDDLKDYLEVDGVTYKLNLKTSSIRFVRGAKFPLKAGSFCILRGLVDDGASTKNPNYIIEDDKGLLSVVRYNSLKSRLLPEKALGEGFPQEYLTPYGKFTLRHNKSKKYATGKIFPSNNCGSVQILGLVDRPTKSGVYITFLVKFLNTGYISTCNHNSLRLGEFKDPLRPTFEGVGFLGVGPHIAVVARKYTPEGSLWSGMLSRGHSEHEKLRHPTYRDCSVDPRWHNFQAFCEDLPKVPGYNLWKSTLTSEGEGRNPYELDKDIRVPGNKVYSLETCSFVTAFENTLDAVKRKGYRTPC